MRNILVIGGSSSIGDSIEKLFVENGDNVFSTYHSSLPKNANDRVTSINLDITSRDASSSLIEIFDKKGKVDALIILAGILPGKSIEEYSNDKIEEVINTNFTSHIHLIKTLTPYLNIDSNIIIMSSISGIRGSFDPVYAATKAALIGLVKSLALWNKDKYKINAVAPSLIEESSMFFGMSKKRRDFHKNNSPSKKLISKSQISKIIFNICESDSKYCNGEIIEINGGTSF